MQVMGTWSPDKSQPDLITHVKVEPAHESDASAMLPAIEDTTKRGLDPKELLADSLYGSDGFPFGADARSQFESDPKQGRS